VKSKTLLIATTNKKKLGEFETLFKDFPLEFRSLKDFPQIKEVEETGKTFEENAALKALGYAKQTGLLTLGEDSGLCCDALEGAPGVYSARFAGEGKSDADNNQKLLRLLEKVPTNCRGAHYKSVIAIAEPGKLIGTVEGEVHGVIHPHLEGTGGFGYDPLFFYTPYGKTFGEISPEMKHKVSHRAKAFEKVKLLLREYLAS
jgi:non-canonical purine NTP pyrophosphatase (RdgB/HAM1 family)